MTNIQNETGRLTTKGINVLHVSDVHVPRRAGVDREGKSQRKWSRVLILPPLPPPNLHPKVVEGQFLEGSKLVEGSSGADKGNELSKVLLKMTHTIQSGGEHTVTCLSCMYQIPYKTPPLMALNRSS